MHPTRPYANSSAQIARVTAKEHITAGVDVARVLQSGERVVDSTLPAFASYLFPLKHSGASIKDMIDSGSSDLGRANWSCRRSLAVKAPLARA